MIIYNCTIYRYIQILAGSNITISNCTIYDCRGNGICTDDLEGAEPLTDLPNLELGKARLG